MSFRSNLTLATALMIAPLAVPAVALASPVNMTEFETTVAHGDLDLTTRDGVSRLDERVRTKVRQLCQNGGRDGASVRLERECRTTAFASAERQVQFAIAEANANANADRARLAAKSIGKGADTPGA